MNEQHPLFEHAEQPTLLDHLELEQLVDGLYEFYDHEAVEAMRRLYRPERNEDEPR